MATLLYSPEVQIIVSTDSGDVDISADIVSGSITLRENSTHQMSCVLMNKGRRYDKIFKPNDRFVVYMKRLTKLLVMTGYLDTVPFYSVWPRSVQINGSSTLKKLQYTFWDPNTTNAIQEFNSGAYSSDGTLKNDALIQSLATNLLKKVGGWDPEKIHFSALPSDWYSKITSLYYTVAPRLGLSTSGLSAMASLGGVNAFTDGTASTTLLQPGGPEGSELPAVFGKASQVDAPQYTCQMHWGYKALDGSVPSNIDPNAVKQFVNSQKVVVASPESNLSVIVQVGDWGPGLDSVIGLDKDTYAYLQLSDTSQVQIAWMDNSHPASLGPYTANSNTVTGIINTIGSTLDTLFNKTPVQFGSSDNTESSNAKQAVSFALSQVGVPYVYGGTGPNGYDCSGLMYKAWLLAGAQIPRTSEQQFSGLEPVPTTHTENWLPGDLVFYGGSGYDGDLANPGHVKMYIGNNQTVEAPYTGQNVTIQPIDTGPGFAGIRRVTSAHATAVTPSTSTSTSSDNNSFFTLYTALAQSPGTIDNLINGTPQAMMLDTPLLPTIQTLVNASMRSFCSAPNGDFIAWYPDYFNVYGQMGVMQIEPIEIQDFTVMWSDLNMVTHQFAAGTFNPTSLGPINSLGAGLVQAVNQLITGGVATIDFPQILEATMNVSPSDPTFSPEAIYARFGARSSFSSMGTLFGPVAEFWYAVYLFQMGWASQFASNVSLSFMPELYPGMIMQIPSNGVEDIGFQAYVQEVTHTWDLHDGAGFSTQVTIAAPSEIGNPGLWGFAQGSQGVV